MIVKTFSGASLRDALDSVRKAFGNNAVIIDTSFDAPAGGRLSHRDRGVRVTAAFEPNPTDQKAIEGAHSLTLKGELAEPQVDDITESAPESDDLIDATPAAGPVEEQNTAPAALSNNIVDELIQQFSAVSAGFAETNENATLIAWLATQPRLAGEMIEAYATHVAETLPPFGPFLERDKSPLRVLFVGGRGSGRSNAMFKACASRWRNKQIQPSVLVVSDAPTPGHEHLAAVCQRCSLEFVAESTDTGRFSLPRSFKKSDLFAEFVPSSTHIDLDHHARSVRKSINPDVVVLVVSATESPAHWERVSERFSAFKPTHLVVTHWDEHEPWSDLAAFARRHELSISYRISGSDLFDELDPVTEADVRNGISTHVARSFAPKAGALRVKGGAR